MVHWICDGRGQSPGILTMLKTKLYDKYENQHENLGMFKLLDTNERHET